MIDLLDGLAELLKEFKGLEHFSVAGEIQIPHVRQHSELIQNSERKWIAKFKIFDINLVEISVADDELDKRICILLCLQKVLVLEHFELVKTCRRWESLQNSERLAIIDLDLTDI